MSEKDDGGMAFPASVAEIQGIAATSADCGMSGMSLRDYFAGQVVTGLISVTKRGPSIDELDTYASGAAAIAYMVADAMIAERAK